MKIFPLFRTIPPALRATSLYTREALIFCETTKNRFIDTLKTADKSAVFLFIRGVHEHEHFFEQVEHLILRHDAHCYMRLACGADCHPAGEARGYRGDLLHIEVVDIEQQLVALAPDLIDVVLGGIRPEQ